MAKVSLYDGILYYGILYYFKEVLSIGCGVKRKEPFKEYLFWS
jgi:hypothetical protein